MKGKNDNFPEWASIEDMLRIIQEEFECDLETAAEMFLTAYSTGRVRLRRKPKPA